MNRNWHGTLRTTLPSWLWEALRRSYRLAVHARYSPFRAPIEAVQFKLRMRRLRALLRQAVAESERGGIGLPLIQQVIEAWNNPGYVCDAGFLRESCAPASMGSGSILDCGSGISTVLLAALAARRDVTVWSLEQDEAWYHEMLRVLRALRLTNVVLWHTPLRSYGDFVWFDLDGRELPRHFSIVSCDGPAVTHTAWPSHQYAQWRVGVVPVLKNLDVSFEQIFLDDAEDPRCAVVVERWRREGLLAEEVGTPTGRLVRASWPP